MSSHTQQHTAILVHGSPAAAHDQGPDTVVQLGALVFIVGAIVVWCRIAYVFLRWLFRAH